MMMKKWWCWFKYWFIDCDNDKLADCVNKSNGYGNEDIDNVCLNDHVEGKEDDDNGNKEDDGCNDDTNSKDNGDHDDGYSFSLSSFFEFVNIIIISEVYFGFPDVSKQISKFPYPHFEYPDFHFQCDSLRVLSSRTKCGSRCKTYNFHSSFQDSVKWRITFKIFLNCGDFFRSCGKIPNKITFIDDDFIRRV